MSKGPFLSLPRLLMAGGILFAAIMAGLTVFFIHSMSGSLQTAQMEENLRSARLYIVLTGFSAILCAALLAICIYWVYRRRIATPLKRFHTTLENISEGFIEDELPEEEWAQADPGIAGAARMVLQINRQLLRTVDNLEKGFEEERLAKLRQIELTRAYERFVPHQFLSYLQKDSITQVKLGDHVDTEMTILFSDMRSFTSLSENISPEENFKFLNSYLNKMEPVIQHSGGFIDKYIGDAIMALFAGSPDDALDAATMMLSELSEYNEGRRRAGYPEIRIGIGLNTGRMMLGIVGGENRMEGTVISDAVNLASRIEEMNKTYGTSVLLSENTVASLREPDRFLLRKIDRVQAKGKTKPVLLYELFDADSPPLRDAKQVTKARFEEALALFHEGRLTEALEQLRACEARNPDDPVIRMYIERISLSNLERESR